MFLIEEGFVYRNTVRNESTNTVCHYFLNHKKEKGVGFLSRYKDFLKFEFPLDQYPDFMKSDKKNRFESVPDKEFYAFIEKFEPVEKNS